MSLTGDTVWRDHVVAGNSSSGKNKPNKAEIRAWARTIEGAANSSTVVKATLAALQAVTPAAETNGGIVLNDATASNNGFYYRSGGAWVKGRGFPDSVAVLTSIGGTANAITASTEAGVNPADVQMIILPDPPGTNTSQTVTITLNGGSAENIKAAAGGNVALGDIIAGVGTAFFRFGTEWRQLFSSATGATFDHQGDYDALTTYTEGQVVTGSDGNWYQLKAASATGDDPVSGGSGDWLLILLGAVIADGSLTEPKYATGSVSTRVLADGAATTDKLGAEAVTEAKVDSDFVSNLRYVDPNGPRIPVGYYSAYAVQITGVRSVAMGGFRWKGKYKVGRAPVFDMPAFTDAERHVIDLGDASGTMISGATGANIGNMTANGGLAAAFDGDTSKVYADSAVGSTTDGQGYVGKDYSSAPKRIQRIRLFPSTDFWMDSTGSASTITLTLRGKNGSAPASGSDGTSLGTWSGSDIADVRQVISTDLTTAWDYVWVQMASSAGTSRVCAAQVEFYEYAPQPGDLFAESEHAKSCWYAQFAAANDGDPTAALGSMPFLRVGSIAGNVVTLNQSGENQRSIAAKSHAFDTDGLVGCDVLVITETMSGRANGWSGRLTTVTANTQTTVTLADVGTMDEYDYFLIAPPGFDHYAYLNTAYMDTGEIRNVADDGLSVASRGVANNQASISGAGVGSTMMPFDGMISPLATAVRFVHRETIASAQEGGGTIRWAIDTSHDIAEFVYQKNTTSSAAYAFSFPPLSFGFRPQLWFFYANTLNIAQNTRQVDIRGWVEP